MRVLVLTTCRPDDRKALTCVRGLGLAGCDVSVASERHLGEAYFSKYSRSLVHLPHPADEPEEYRQRLFEHINTNSYQVILPTNDYTALALANDEERLRELVSIPMPNKDAVDLALNKSAVLNLARELGLSVPRTFSVKSREEVPKRVEELGYPCIVKLNRGAGATGLLPIYGPNDLDGLKIYNRQYTDPVFDFGHLLVQEKLVGEIHEVGAIFCRGEPRLTFTQRRIHMYPPRAGAGILNETTDEPDLVAAAVKLLKKMCWHGPAQVEFLRDARDNTPYLMEVNGRLWGTLALAVEAGLNIPYLVCRLASDGDIPAYSQYEVGLRYRWPLPLGLLHTLETGEYCRGFRDFFCPSPQTSSDIWLTDLMPHLAELFFMLQRGWARRSAKPAQRGRPWRISRVLPS